jgi:hypothetical protein
MRRKSRTFLWTFVFVVLVALAIPWFLWGDSRVVAGLPLWLWWHIGWMALATVAFYAFAQSDWDRLMGVTRG